MNSFEQSNEPDSGTIARKAVGYLLIFVGIAIGLWVISFIHDLFGDPSQIGLINAFSGEIDGIVTFPSGEVELPAGFFVAGGYLVACILLSICAGLAKAFLTSGAHLVQSDFKKLVTRLTGELKGSDKGKG